MASFLQQSSGQQRKAAYSPGASLVTDEIFEEFSNFRNDVRKKYDEQNNSGSSFTNTSPSRVNQSHNQTYSQPLSGGNSNLQSGNTFFQQSQSKLKGITNNPYSVRNTTPLNQQQQNSHQFTSGLSNTVTSGAGFVSPKINSTIDSTQREIKEIGITRSTKSSLNLISGPYQNLMSPQLHYSPQIKNREQQSYLSNDTDSNQNGKFASLFLNNKFHRNVNSSLIGGKTSNPISLGYSVAANTSSQYVSGSPQFNQSTNSFSGNDAIPSNLQSFLSPQNSGGNNNNSNLAAFSSMLKRSSPKRIFSPKQTNTSESSKIFSPVRKQQSLEDNKNKIFNNIHQSFKDQLKNQQIHHLIPINQIFEFEDVLVDATDAEINDLPRHYVEELLKLSSIIMFKVKTSNFYKRDIQ